MASPFRKDLSAPGLIQAIYHQFSKIADPREFAQPGFIALKDHLMSGLAVFGLKCPSLLEYDRKRKDPPTALNLRDLYHVENPPSDTYLREHLDQVDPDALRPAFKKLFFLFQRGKGLEGFEFMDGYILISLDGTGLFSSNNVCCPQCCVKRHSNGTASYYHQMLSACVVHQDKRNVIPLCPEVILNQDGSSKNDCERNAIKRFLENFRREHPFLRSIIIADGLSSTTPNVRLLEEGRFRYILGAKPGNHQFLFDHLESRDDSMYHEITAEDGQYHQFRFLNEVSLNKSNRDLKVNMLEYRHTDCKGKDRTFSWITNIKVSKSNALKIATGGRARWKIENETSNTLKNLGYNFEHNYGHGEKYLSTVFCLLMMLAFLIDQIQEIACDFFRRSKRHAGTYRGLWAEMSILFKYLPLRSWENFYALLARDIRLDTS